jgi:hypothetical protein
MLGNGMELLHITPTVMEEPMLLYKMPSICVIARRKIVMDWSPFNFNTISHIDK